MVVVHTAWNSKESEAAVAVGVGIAICSCRRRSAGLGRRSCRRVLPWIAPDRPVVGRVGQLRRVVSSKQRVEDLF